MLRSFRRNLRFGDMSRGKRRRNWGNGRGAKRVRDGASGDARPEEPRRADARVIVKENKAFEEYYKRQNIVPEGEWEAFMEAFRTDLPVVFRVAGVRSLAEDISKCLEETYFNKLTGIVIDDTPVDPPAPLKWYPDRVAWQVNLTRKQVRKSEELAYFKKFLVRESEQGNITRQEAVSMIPPLLMDVKPHHYVLDMCAAPGSKTAQIIEMMHARDGSVPDGLLVANDKDNKRCYMLVHQTKRLNSPCLVVLNEDASCIPNLCLDDRRKEPIVFDRILCDVPCSGDGTLRKNMEVWRKWTAANGNGLHRLQKRILRRGLEMLAVGGRLVYSTCSLNPVEDEAVVSALIEQSQGTVELVDCSADLPDLKRSPGIATWTVTMRDGTVASSHDELSAKQKEDFPPSMFPSTYPNLHLERCWRVLPHFQNTGGFFIVALKKTGTLPWMKAAPAPTPTKTQGEATPSAAVGGDGESGSAGAAPAAEAAAEPRKPRRIFGKSFKEDPFVFFTGEDDPSWKAIEEYFQLGDGIKPDQLLTRSHGGKKRAIYMTSPIISKMLPKNDDQVKVVNTGVRVFARSTQSGAACDFRLVQEGLHAVLPHINARRFTVSPSDALLLLKNWSPQLFDLSKDLQKAVEDADNGSCVLTLPAGAIESTDGGEGHVARSLSCPLHFSGWKSRYTLRLLVTADDRAHFLMLLGQGKIEDIQAEVEAQMNALQGREKKKGGDGVDVPMDDEQEEAGGKAEAQADGEEATAVDDASVQPTVDEGKGE